MSRCMNIMNIHQNSVPDGIPNATLKYLLTEVFTAYFLTTIHELPVENLVISDLITVKHLISRGYQIYKKVALNSIKLIDFLF